MRLTSSVSVAQTIIALSSVELTSILVPSHRLRIMALLSSGCRATVDGLTNVQSSSTTQQWQATSLDDNNLHVPCRQSSKHFISGQLKVIPLFRYSVFRVLQRPRKKWVGRSKYSHICNYESHHKFKYNSKAGVYVRI